MSLSLTIEAALTMVLGTRWGWGGVGSIRCRCDDAVNQLSLEDGACDAENSFHAQKASDYGMICSLEIRSIYQFKHMDTEKKDYSVSYYLYLV